MVYFFLFPIKDMIKVERGSGPLILNLFHEVCGQLYNRTTYITSILRVWHNASGRGGGRVQRICQKYISYDKKIYRELILKDIGL